MKKSVLMMVAVLAVTGFAASAFAGNNNDEGVASYGTQMEDSMKGSMDRMEQSMDKMEPASGDDMHGDHRDNGTYNQG